MGHGAKSLRDSPRSSTRGEIVSSVWVILS